MTILLAQFSDSVVSLVAASAPALVAIRTGANQHITGIVWSPEVIVTSDQALPPREDYTVVLATGMVAAARPVQRDPARNLASLRLEYPIDTVEMAASPPLPVGSLLVVLGADFDGTPTARISALHRQARRGRDIVLDMDGTLVEHGGLVLNAQGGLLGMASVGPAGEAIVVPCDVITDFAEAPQVPHPLPVPEPPRPVPVLRRPMAVAPASPPPRITPSDGPASERRGWLGVALQPITVPEPLVPRAGQASGRLVVSITAGGPAERAGLRVGDVLLALNGHSTTGSYALRTFLGADRIGSQVEASVLREGALRTVTLTVAQQP